MLAPSSVLMTVLMKAQSRDNGGVTFVAEPVANRPETILLPFQPVQVYCEAPAVWASARLLPACQLMLRSVRFSMGASASEKMALGPATSVSTTFSISMLAMVGVADAFVGPRLWL